MKLCKRFVVAGRVQGVFFRKYTLEESIKLGLTGWVRNCANGNVEVVACGEAEWILELEQWLHIGSPLAKVKNLQKFDEKYQDFSGFSIERDA